MLNSATTLIQRDNQGGSPMQTMYYIGLDVHKKKISYCVKEEVDTFTRKVRYPLREAT